MINTKTKKELAFIYDLCVAPDWGERFAQLLDKKVKLPAQGRVLCLGAGTGGNALVLQRRCAPEVHFFCVEEDAERLELARAKASTMKVKMHFAGDELDNLDFPDGHFALVTGDLSFLPAERVADVLTEAARVTGAGGALALGFTTAGSFGEFFSLYWEALFNAELDGGVAEKLIATQITVDDLTKWALKCGLKKAAVETSREEFTYESGKELMTSPLVADFLWPRWSAEVAAGNHERLAHEITRSADSFREDADFTFSVKATILSGHK